MFIEDLISNAHQANQQLIDSIAKDFKDTDILAELKNIPKIVTDSLQKVERLINRENQLKETLKSEMTRLRKLIESKMGLIAANSTNHLEKIQAIELLGKIINSYVTLYEYFYTQLKRKPISRWQDERLYLEQTVCKEKSIGHALKELLTAVNKMAEKKCIVPNQCFISYAWSGGDTSHEKWVQPFLNTLRTHLMQAGINTLLDIKDDLPGGSVFHYMNRIKDSDCVIVVGTESLFQQHESGVGRACNELILINQNRQQHMCKTLPILLSGCFENALPPYFLIYSNIIDWRENSYLNNLKQLIANIYEINPDTLEYQQKWTVFESQYPSLIRGFSEKEIHKQLAIEEKLKAQKKKLNNQQVMQWFNKMNVRMLSPTKSGNISQEPLLTWDTLIKCVKAEYIATGKFKTVLGEAQEISHCYINLTIVEEKEQREKEKVLAKEMHNQGIQEIEQSSRVQKLTKKMSEREAWLNSYEEIHGTKTSISPQDIHKHQKGKVFHRQLILGRAGIGKSTLCQYIAYQWAKEEWWRDESFTLLVWIPLRQLANKKVYPKEGGETITLGKVFYEQFKEQFQTELPTVQRTQWIETLDKLIKEHFSEILYVLDGFDEVANICQLNDRKATRQTQILNQLLRQGQVIITSRPYYIDNYLNTQGIKIDRRLENIGFVDKDIQNYVQRYLWRAPEQQRTLQLLLNNNRLIRGIAHIPINLALLCRYWSTQILAENNYLSITDLYEGLVSDLLYEYLGRQSGRGYIDFVSATTNSVLNNKKAQPILQFLEKLAFLQMQEESLIISKERIANLLKEFGRRVEVNKWQGFKSVLGAGLLVSPDEQEKRFEDKREHYFIHLTFQEFLAARYIARLFKQSDDSSVEVVLLEGKKSYQRISNQSLSLFMKNHKYDPRYEMVWWFVAGLLKRHKQGIERFFNSLLSEPRSFSGWYEVLLGIKCLEESELTNNLSEVLKRDLVEDIRKIAQTALNSKMCISDKQYSKTFFEYLYSSPMVYEELNLLQTKEMVREALNILWWHPNLPSGVLNNIVNLLMDREADVRHLALKVLCHQVNLPSSVLYNIVSLLSNENWEIRRSALVALACQANLPSSILNDMVSLLNDKNLETRRWMREALARQVDLPLSILDNLSMLLFSKETDVKISTLNTLVKQKNLSFSILEKIVNLLMDKDKSVKHSALQALGQLPNLPISALEKMTTLLADQDRETKSLALTALGQQPNLPVNVLEKMVSLLNDENENVRSSALTALGQQPNLPISILKKMESFLSDENGNARSLALNALGQQPNLPFSILKKMVSLLSDENGNVRSSVPFALGQQPNLPISILKKMESFLSDKNGNVRSSALDALGQQPNLPISILKKMESFLSDKNGNVRSSALDALGQQPNLPISILEKMESFLNDEDLAVKRSALQTLSQLPNLPISVLERIATLLADQDREIKNSTLFALGQQPNLPFSILERMVNLLSDQDKRIRCSALEALSKQPNLSSSILHYAVSSLCDKDKKMSSAAPNPFGSLMNLLSTVLFSIVPLPYFKNKIYIPNKEEISFINQQLVSILDNPELNSQLASTTVLLSNVILENTFSSKNVAYFENDQSLILRLGNQLKQITIKDKNEFIQTFIEQRESWLNNQDTNYSSTQPFISLKPEP